MMVLIAMTTDYWMAELAGNPYDLQCLHRWFSSESDTVVKENDKFFLTGSLFLQCMSADEAIHRADARLELMSAAGRLESASEALNVKVKSAVYVDQVGVKHYYEFLEAGIRVGALVRSFDYCSPSLPQRAVVVAECDIHIDMALRLWGENSRTWPRLYLILEEIANSFDPTERYPSVVLSSHGLVESKEDVFRFINSACNPEIAGRDSRHAKGNHKMPKELQNHCNPAMAHHEAVVLIGSVLKRAIRRKWELISEGSAN